MVQWFGVCTSNAGGMGSIPGWGTKIPHAAWHGKKDIFFPSEFLNTWQVVTSAHFLTTWTPGASKFSPPKSLVLYTDVPKPAHWNLQRVPPPQFT